MTASQQNTPTETYTPHGLGRRWELCTESVRRMIREGRLEAIRIGRQLRVPRSAVEAYEAAHKVNR